MMNDTNITHFPRKSNTTQTSSPSLFLTHDTIPTSNQAWGYPLTPKTNKTLRIIFQNINGVQSNINWNKRRDIVAKMSANQVDIMGLAETNINWNQLRNKNPRKYYVHNIGVVY